MIPSPLSSACALFLDFDGTLSPLQDNPDAVFLPPSGAKTLGRISTALNGALAIVSGRDIHDLSARIPAGLWRAGGHGAVICAPHTPLPSSCAEPPADVVETATSLASQFRGATLERKGTIIALHFRSAPQHRSDILKQVALQIGRHPSYTALAGNMVVEFRPRGIHKGRAIGILMGHAPFSNRKPVMVGDDTTDEEAMETCLHMGGTCVRVGSGNSIAPFRLADSSAVWQWLEASFP